MVIRTAICIALAGVAAAAQPRIERGDTARVPRGRIAPLAAEANVRGTIVPINGRRTSMVRFDTAGDALASGFTRAQLEAFGVFAPGGAVANGVVGFARDANADVLPGAETQLRDLGRGAVVGHYRTNGGGQFAYAGLPPGTYIVELLSGGGTVLALSDAVSIGSGEVVQTVVQLSAPTRSFAGWMSGATATAVNSAVEAGVLALEPAPSASPES